MFVVRSGRVRWHAYLQSAVVLVNLPVILIWMVPAYVEYVMPGIPGEIAQSFYLVPSVMLVVGGFAQALGLYLILVAGTNWIPERWRFRNYKLWMRTELALWWIVLSTGLLTYYVWFVMPPGSS